jgi:hypothetical protein
MPGATAEATRVRLPELTSTKNLSGNRLIYSSLP